MLEPPDYRPRWVNSLDGAGLEAGGVHLACWVCTMQQQQQHMSALFAKEHRIHSRCRFAVALAPDEPEPEAQQQAADEPAAPAAAQQVATGTAASPPANSGVSASAFPSPVRSEGGPGVDENAAWNAMPGGGSSGKTFGLGFILPQLVPGSRPATPAAPAVPTPELLEGLGAAVTTAGAAGTARGPSRPPSAQAPAQPQAPAGEAEGGQEEEEEEDAAEALGDSDAGCILGLFPQPVRQAIVEACLASSSQGSSSGSSSQLGGTAQRRLVELCVDKGGRWVL